MHKSAGTPQQGDITPAGAHDAGALVIEGEYLPHYRALDIRAVPPLARPPALRTQVSCLCGKRTLEAHGPFTCHEVLAIAARVKFGQRHPLARLVARLRGQAPEGWPS
jgi:hypothetical protein